MERLDQAWTRGTAIAVVGSLVLFGALAFVIVPIVDGAAAGLDAFTAICLAIGIGGGNGGAAASAAPSAGTRVAWTAPAFATLDGADKTAGAAVAQATCVACHTAEGPTADPSIPVLAGQSIFAIYKELQDFKSGARANETMAPIAQALEPKQMADVAAYYARLSRADLASAADHPSFAGPEIAALALNGDAARALPPCAACHAGGAGGPLETPALAGQSAPYVAAQLKAFADGSRHNDAFERMRSIAANLTPREMALLAAYYTTPH